jgi:hypothetical protein
VGCEGRGDIAVPLMQVPTLHVTVQAMTHSHNGLAAVRMGSHEAVKSRPGGTHITTLR